MKTVLRLLIIFLLLFSMAAFSSCDRLVPEDNKEIINPDDDDKDDDIDATSSPTGENNTPSATPTTTPKDQSPHSSVEVNREDTLGQGTTISDLDQYGLNSRLQGLVDDSNPHGIEDHTNGIIATRNAFIINERFKDEIIGGITLGDSFAAIKSVLGSTGWETEDILLYRSQNYYLLFHGNQKAEFAVFMMAPNAEYDQNILSRIIEVLNSKDYTSLEESLSVIDPTGTFFESSGFINGGGYYASSLKGISIIDFDEKTIEVYSNYQGALFDHTAANPRYEVRFVDRDMAIDAMLNDLNRYFEIEELFSNEAVVSPDGKLSAVFEWVYSMDQHFIVRTLDHTIQDRYIYASTLTEFQWLTNSHLIYIDTYNEMPYAIDVNFSDPSAINILYEAGVIKEKDVDLGQYKFEILGIKNNVISLKDTLTNTTYAIAFKEDKNGVVTFSLK